jgi:hypothetical protein
MKKKVKKVLKFWIASEPTCHDLYVARRGDKWVNCYSCRKSALRGARRYAKRNGYTEFKEV